MKPFHAVISDMDGVLTRTAQTHERAWTRMFDEFLTGKKDELGEKQRPFSGADYRTYVDGKPRYDGVADFLRSRGIDLPRGQISDAPSEKTVCGLGNRKNALFRELLESGGVQVFEDATAALARWRRGGMKIAIVSSSRNCPFVLKAAGLEHCAEVVVDGTLGHDLGLSGKRGLLLEAARRLGVEPATAVVLEDATAGVRAARESGFGRVIGVDRSEHGPELEAAGAHEIVRDVYATRLARRLPSASDRMEELFRWQRDRALVVFLDFDGTLAPIVDNPGDAGMSPEMRSTVQELARRCPVAIVSGRDREDVEARVGIGGLYYAGSHGFDISGGGHSKTLPEAEAAIPKVDRAEADLKRRLEGIAGVIIERKRFSVAAHYRKVSTESAVQEVERVVDAIQAETKLRKRGGKKVFELEPAVEWHKGYALKWLIDVLPVDPRGSFFVYVGDDETDEDAFSVLREDGAGVRVGPEITMTLADYRLGEPSDVREFLQGLMTHTGR